VQRTSSEEANGIAQRRGEKKRKKNKKNQNKLASRLAFGEEGKSKSIDEQASLIA
jgi:hypothetical protein